MDLIRLCIAPCTVWCQVDTAGTLSSLSRRLQEAGAANVYLCASHGLFTEDSVQRIEQGSVKKVLVTNTLPMPRQHTDKIEQVSVAPLLAKVILTEHFRSNIGDTDHYEMD